MSQDERKRRPPLARTRPVRDWSTMLGQDRSGTRSTGSGSTGKAAKQDSSPSGDQSDGAPAQSPSSNDAITRSVELGYRVVDDYIRRGQAAAEGLRAGTYDGSALARDARDLAERMVRSVSDVIGAWGELLELSSNDEAARARFNGHVETDASTASPAGTDTGARCGERDAPRGTAFQIRVRVESDRPVEVSLDVDAAVDGRTLVVQSLRAADGAGSSLRDVSCRVDDDGMPAVVVRVGARQSASVYRGALVDGRTGERVGSLSVTVRGR